ncbi:MAG: PAS domain-containing protein [Thermodesulfobacteriota bacterium]
MKLRFILTTLSLLAFFSVSIGGYLYYTSLRNAAFMEADRNATARLNAIHRNVLTFLSETVKPVRVLAGMEALAAALDEPNPERIDRANAVLDYFTQTLDANVCYLLDRDGNTIASSNRHAPDSFVGLNFSFRPYFQEAMAGRSHTYLALGTKSDLRGAYYSHSIRGAKNDGPIGVAVIKVAIDAIEQKIGLSEEDIVLVVDPKGVIFISSQRSWLLQLAWPLAESEIEAIRKKRQFGDGPFRWIGLRRVGDELVIDENHVQYSLYQKALDSFEGWQILYLRNRRAILQQVVEPLVHISGPIVLIVSLLIAVSVFVLYQEASSELKRRKQAEKALEESMARYRNLYHQTPAMLHSIDGFGNLIRVSEYWLEAMEYKREDVIGKPLVGFLTPESRRYAEQIVIPQFFRSGFCKDIPYHFVTGTGRIIDVLLSAIAERNERGDIVQSLSVSIDVTERNRAVQALQEAQEALKHHSRKLEIEVARRTREISGILRYSPNVVYLKDRNDRFRLVNTRFELLFGLPAKTVIGKTIEEILPKEIAQRFSRIDRQVLESGDAIQHEETVSISETPMTFLTVTFPLFDDAGGPAIGVCSILTDVTEAKKLQDQYRRLSASILENQERERAAIARELHDELGQVLTALRMDAVWLRNRLQNVDLEAASRADGMCASIDQNIQEIRSIALRLRPRVLDDLGLVDALEWFTSDFERRTGIACIFRSQPLPSVTNALATAAYRIVQEALTNVARHAQASFAEVSLSLQDNRLQILVADNGVGFDVEKTVDVQGLGIAGMRERALLVGGVIEVASEPGSGTKLVFKAPFG